MNDQGVEVHYMSSTLSELMRKPVRNWWHEDEWLNWYRDLQQVTKDLKPNNPISIHVSSLLPEQLLPHGLHHSRWDLFYDKLEKIMGNLLVKEKEN